MRTLDVWSLLFCLTEIEGVTWRPQDYTTSKMKKIVKGEEIKGYFEIMVGNQRKRFDNDNRADFLPYLYNAMATKIKSIITVPIEIVPIPNKIALAKNHDPFPTWDHAKGIATRLANGSTAVDAL